MTQKLEKIKDYFWQKCQDVISVSNQGDTYGIIHTSIMIDTLLTQNDYEVKNSNKVLPSCILLSQEFAKEIEILRQILFEEASNNMEFEEQIIKRVYELQPLNFDAI